MKKSINCLLSLIVAASIDVTAAPTTNPHLLLNKDDVAAIQAQRASLPLFNQAFLTMKSSMEKRLNHKIVVPIPRDAGGGYTHEQHKENYKSIRDAGILYQLTGEQRYAKRARDLLLAYANLYPTLGEHPKKKEQAPGRLFWQSLNESVWLVYSIQGYDTISPTLSTQEKEKIENRLLKPMAIFLSQQSPKTFNKIHNHGTWAAAAVGMTGYVLNDKDMVEKALYGLDKSGNSGFFKQLDKLFSPDGYYTEGPYYQRYALMPFLLFAKAIDYNDPALNIFAYRDNILIKAVYTAIQLSYNNYFFPINDALKDKGLDTIELVYGIGIAYTKTRDPALLSIARKQNTVILSGDGIAVAKGIADNRDKPFPFKSLQLRDGANGRKGALSIIRSGSEPGHQALVMKNTAQGMGHGHFDKLHWLFYDNGNEIISDYGAARFLNVESKYGGHYLPENKTWAKQTIAHNTLVVDQNSHFSANLTAAEKKYPTTLFFDNNEQLQISSARMQGTYPGIDFVRTMAMIKDSTLQYPVVIDVLKVNAKGTHQYDLPLHYHGHIVNTNFPLQAATQQLTPLGKNNGYQHLWQRARANPGNKTAQITWLLDNRFYTYHFLNSKNSEIIFTQLGANDPNFNLRKESAVIQRVKNADNHTFVSLLEVHGEYNPQQEYTIDSYSQISDLKHYTNAVADFIQFKTAKGKTLGLAIAYNSDNNKNHKITIQKISKRWKGFYHLFEN